MLISARRCSWQSLKAWHCQSPTWNLSSVNSLLYEQFSKLLLISRTPHPNLFWKTAVPEYINNVRKKPFDAAFLKKKKKERKLLVCTWESCETLRNSWLLLHILGINISNAALDVAFCFKTFNLRRFFEVCLCSCIFIKIDCEPIYHIYQPVNIVYFKEFVYNFGPACFYITPLSYMLK